MIWKDDLISKKGCKWLADRGLGKPDLEGLN